MPSEARDSRPGRVDRWTDFGGELSVGVSPMDERWRCSGCGLGEWDDERRALGASGCVASRSGDELISLLEICGS